MAEPHELLVASALRNLEVLERIDQERMIGVRREHLAGCCHIHEDKLGIGFGIHAPAPRHGTVSEMELPREGVVSEPQLDDSTSCGEMRAHGLACRNTQDGRHEPEDKYKDFSLHENVIPP